jgi:hypothetical protein
MDTSERMAQAVDAGVKESGAEAVINEFRN